MHGITQFHFIIIIIVIIPIIIIIIINTTKQSYVVSILRLAVLFISLARPHSTKHVDSL